MPSISEAYSTTALSVSISASGVPTSTFWPTATSQVAIAASVTPVSTSGMRIVVAISAPPIPARSRSMPATTSSVRAIAARSSTFEMLGLASLPVTRCTGWSSQSKKRRWISSASHPPYEVPCAPCSTISTALVFLIDSPIVSQSSDARSSQRRSMTSASIPVCSIASTQWCTIDR